MDKTIKLIFRSLNWPGHNVQKFSSRPTPYNISKNLNLNPATVYRNYGSLFSSGYIKNLIFLPSPLIARRQTVEIKGLDSDEIGQTISKLFRIYFVEMAHKGYVYHVSGKMKLSNSTDWLLTVNLIDSSPEIITKQLKILLDFSDLSSREVLVSKEQYSTLPSMDLNVRRIMDYISYRNMFEVKIKDIAENSGKPVRTVTRKLDDLTRRRYFSTYPLLNQSLVKGFGLFVVVILKDDLKDEVKLHDVLNLPKLSENFLLYYDSSSYFNILLYYDSMSEMDVCIEEIETLCNSFIVLTRFESFLNSEISLIFR